MIGLIMGSAFLFGSLLLFGALGLLVDKLAEREGQERVRHEVERMIDNDRRAG